MTTTDQPVPVPVRADRAAGVVLASACGDARGAGYEFGPPLGADTPVLMKGGGSFGWKPGEWTDDTQMALAILTPLAEGGPRLESIEAGFRAWYASDPADVGNQTRAVLGQSGPLAEVAAAHLTSKPGSAGNGSLMRTGPVALAHPGDPEAIAELARAISALTHPGDDCEDACVLWSVAIDHTIHHAPDSRHHWDWADAVRAGLVHLPDDRRSRWEALIDEAATAEPVDFHRNNGWVVNAFQAALAAACATPVPHGDRPGDHLRLALERAVRGGSDTDTVAAIAGALLGARWGATAVPFSWRRLLRGHRVYGEPTLDAADLERMARRAFNGGRPGAQDWPGVAKLVDYYQTHFADRPRRTTIGGVDFGNVHALAEAFDDGVDTVISLCRMGTDDVPTGVEHHVIGLLDTTEAENPNLVLLLAEVVDGIAALKAEGRHVFVHCVQAQNRTPTVAAAWLVHEGATPDDAVSEAARLLNRPKPFLISAVHKSVSG